MTRGTIATGIAIAMLLTVRVANPAVGQIHGIVEISEHCLIGGTQNQTWVAAEQFRKSSKSSGKFELYTLEGPAGEIVLNRNAEGESHES